MTFLFVLLASICAFTANCLMRKTLDYGGTTKGFLTGYFTISCLAACLLNSIFTTEAPISMPMMGLGVLTGSFIFIMMYFTGRALQHGPSGLTFAFQNCGAIFPSLFLALAFSSPFGFELSMGNIVGISLVLIGLFWSAQEKQNKSLSKKWLLFALAIFITQSFILTVFQWRSLLFKIDLPSHTLIPFHFQDTEDMWFMPSLFLGAALFQWVFFFMRERRKLKKSELLGGSIGGIFNGLSTFCLLYATNMATPAEKMLLFPFFAVSVIVLGHFYGQTFYRESVNWKANACCIAGIMVGSLW